MIRQICQTFSPPNFPAIRYMHTYTCTYIHNCIIFKINVEVVYVIISVIYVKQINDNGVISFNSRYNVRTPLSLPLSGSYRIIAPYWADVDTRGTGRIYYRQTSDPALIAKATSEIRRGFPMSQNVTITNLLIATWDAVGYYYRNSDKVCMYTLISAYIIMHIYE